MTNKDQSREAFEAWFSKYHDEACREWGGIDCTNPKGVAEEAWQAASSALTTPVELPEPFALYDGEKWYANEEAAICSCANMQKLQKVYTEQQVREFIKGL